MIFISVDKNKKFIANFNYLDLKNNDNNFSIEENIIK